MNDLDAQIADAVAPFKSLEVKKNNALIQLGIDETLINEREKAKAAKEPESLILTAEHNLSSDTQLIPMAKASLNMIPGYDKDVGKDVYMDFAHGSLKTSRERIDAMATALNAHGFPNENITIYYDKEPKLQIDKEHNAVFISTGAIEHISAQKIGQELDKALTPKQPKQHKGQERF